MTCKNRFPIQIFEYDRTWTLICPECQFKVRHFSSLLLSRKVFLKQHGNPQVLPAGNNGQK